MWRRESPWSLGPWPTRIRHFVASTNPSRRPRSAASQPPMTSSVNPAVSGSGGIGYASAVSMNVTPCSYASSRIFLDVASSACPANVIVPRQIFETLSPVRPIRRCCMVWPPSLGRVAAKHPFVAGSYYSAGLQSPMPRLLVELNHSRAARIRVAGGGARGDAPDAQASALVLPCGQPQPPKRLSPSWDTTNHCGVQREVSQCLGHGGSDDA